MTSMNGHGLNRVVLWAILYARVSTDEQARSGYSLAQQLEAMREYAARGGYEVLEEVVDPGQSGASLERPGMDRVRDLVAGGGVYVVLAQDRDQFAREPAYHYLLMQEFEEHGTKIRALNDRGDDSPEGELTDGILDQLGKYERAKISERSRRGKLQKAREGKVLAVHRPPYGFRYNDPRDNYLVNAERMAVMERIFRMVGVEGYTMNATRLAFNREGVRPPSGEFWSPKYIREAIKDNKRQSANGDRFWELSGGVLYCAECGCRMTVHATLDSRNGRRYCYYRCPKRGRHRVHKVCINGKHHRAAEAEAAVWNVVFGLLKDPERLRAGLDEMIEQERAGMRGNPDQEAASWLEKISEVEQERRGYLRFGAETYYLYNIEYRRGSSQIHHQGAPSRAQAPGAALIGGS